MKTPDTDVVAAHKQATADYSAAANEYEDAMMSGDEGRIAAADARLTAAYQAEGEALAARVNRHRIRQSLPTFEQMLAHPWSQPDTEGLVYKNVLDATVALPFEPGAGLSHD